MRKYLLAAYLLLRVANVSAQDSLRTLNAEQLLNIIRAHHPVVRQSVILVEKSKTEITQARAAFDPVFNSYSSRKSFNGLNYYDYQSPEIRVPTWYGIEVYSGIENLSGNRLDPSQTQGQSSYFGIQVPLAKNLLIDKRRAALAQAKIMNQMSQAEQSLMINNLLMEAMGAYWHWVKTYQLYQLLESQVAVNQKRIELVKQAYLLGERPAIDTVEAIAQLQSFQLERNQQWLNFQNAALQLSLFLWIEGRAEVTLSSSIIPDEMQENQASLLSGSLKLDNLLSFAEANHPDLRKYQFKLESLTVEKKLKFQELLPKVDLAYNHLAKGSEWFATNGINPLFEQNYQYGLKVAIPLRFSQGRGAYKEARLKIEETRLEQILGQQKVALKVRSYFNEMQTLKDQVQLQSANYKNYQELLKAEEMKFMNGESSIFLINARESKALEAREKLIDLQTKYFKSIYALQWSAGLLN
jgi:outer membrane protein TolC